MLRRLSGTDADYGPLELYGQLVTTPSMQTAPVECPAGWIPCSEMPPGATGIVNATYHDCCQVVGGMETADCVNIKRWPITSSVPSLDGVASACSNDMPFRCRFRSSEFVMDRCCSSPSVVPPTGFVLERCVRKPPVLSPVEPPVIEDEEPVVVVPPVIVEPPVEPPVVPPEPAPPGPAPVPSAGFNYIPYLIAGVVALGVVGYLKYGRKK